MNNLFDSTEDAPRRKTGFHNFEERKHDKDLLNLWADTASNTEDEYKAILAENISKSRMNKDQANALFLKFKKAREIYGIPVNLRVMRR